MVLFISVSFNFKFGLQWTARSGTRPSLSSCPFYRDRERESRVQSQEKRLDTSAQTGGHYQTKEAIDAHCFLNIAILLNK